MKRYPLIKLLLVYIIGIVVQVYFPVKLIFLLVPCFFVIAALILFFSVKSISGKYSQQWLFGVALTVLVFFIGGLTIALRNNSNIQNNMVVRDNLVDTVSYIAIADLISEPLERDKSLKADIRVIALRAMSDSLYTSYRDTSFQAMVYFTKDKHAAQLQIGERIIVSGRFTAIANAGNPDEFDFKRYLSYRGIHKQIFVSSDKWQLLDNSGSLSLKIFAIKVRSKLLSLYKKYGIGGDEFAVLGALTLGYKDKLDEDLKRAYSSSGAMHILSVSGLHVGIIYIIFSRLLFFLDKIRHGWRIKNVLVLLLMFFFAFLSGLSPSVQRATTMFIFIIIGDLLGRNANIYNSLAASAFFLITIDPYLIFDVGFELSYIAVIAIVYLQPKLSGLLTMKNKYVDYFWQLLTVSAAAQIGTFPLGMYYFHQFSNYFFITNMLVIPLSFVIMLLACVLLFVSFIPFIAKLIALVLGMSVKLLNYCVVSIEELPYSVTSNIYINFEQLVLLFIFLSFIVLFFVYRRVRLLYVAILSLAVIFVISSIHNYQISRQNYFVVFNSKGNPAYNFLDGRSNVLLADSALLNNPKRLAYLAGSFWISRGVTAIDTFNIRTLYQNNAETIHPLKNNLYRWQANKDWLLGNHFITYRNKKFLFIRNNLLAGVCQKQKTPIDYVILSNNSNLELSDLLSFVTPRLVIVDSSNSTNRKNKWKLDCSNNGINYYVVSEKGAFITKL